MNWVVRIADDAQLFIQNLPDKARRQVSGSISQLEQDPFRGDVKPLKGEEWEEYYRKRAGDYRITAGFTTSHSPSLVQMRRSQSACEPIQNQMMVEPSMTPNAR